MRLEENRGPESLEPLPVLATNRGRDTDNAAEFGGGVLEPAVGLSLVLEKAPVGFAFDARNVLLTETALKVAGFLTAEPVRP